MIFGAILITVSAISGLMVWLTERVEVPQSQPRGHGHFSGNSPRNWR
jgi:hypothetical protein